MARSSRSVYLWFAAISFLCGGYHTVGAVEVTALRLVNTLTTDVGKGRVEIQVENIPVWGSICVHEFDYREANVICRMLGFSQGGTAVTDGSFGSGNYNFLMDDTLCDGTEDSLSDCVCGTTIDCRYQVDKEAGVECSGSGGSNIVTMVPPAALIKISTSMSQAAAVQHFNGECDNQTSTPRVRLYGSTETDGMGFVEVMHPVTGLWGFICDDKWSKEAATVVCRELCYHESALFCPRPGILAELMKAPPSPNVILDDVECIGNESNIYACRHSAWGSNNCRADEKELAGVQCLDLIENKTVFNEPFVKCHDGAIIVSFYPPNFPEMTNANVKLVRYPDCPEGSIAVSRDYFNYTIPLQECGTNLYRNATDIIYENELEYSWKKTVGPVFTGYDNRRYLVQCCVPVLKTVDARFQPFTNMTSMTVKRVYDYEMKLDFYENEKCEVLITENPYHVEVGQMVYAAITIKDFDLRLKIVATDCVANPIGNPASTIVWDLFRNKCPVDPSLTIYPISVHKQGMRFRAFKFTGYSLVYIHCEVTVCLENEVAQECDRTCLNTKPIAGFGRKRREASGIDVALVESPAMIFSEKADIERGSVNPKASRSGNHVLTIEEKAAKKLTYMIGGGVNLKPSLVHPYVSMLMFVLIIGTYDRF